MIRRLRTLSILLIAGTWLALCGIGLSTPTLIRQQMVIAIENLKRTEIGSESVNKWEALRPISDFTRQTGNLVVLLSTLMLVGIIGHNICTRTKETPNQHLQGATLRSDLEV